MTAARQISVLLVEDHIQLRRGLCALLESDGIFKVVGNARTGREAVAMARSLRPDVILMDIAMPGLSGLEATRLILAQDPAARVLILSVHSDAEYIEQASEAGVVGFIEKQTSAATLVRTIQDVAAGKTAFSSSVVRRLADLRAMDRGRRRAAAGRLTPREGEVLQLVVQGVPAGQVATALGISVKTVLKHRQQMMGKLRVRDTAGLTRYAIAAGIIESSVRLTLV
jgi:DNA-binding NarL/FixJ family response regulator